MQKWEYYYHFTSSGLQADKLSGWDELTRTAKTIAQLGEEGWEMVGCITLTLYFKRPKP